MLIVSEVVQEALNFASPHSFRVSFSMKKNKLFNPEQVGFFGANAVVMKA